MNIKIIFFGILSAFFFWFIQNEKVSEYKITKEFSIETAVEEAKAEETTIKTAEKDETECEKLLEDKEKIKEILAKIRKEKAEDFQSGEIVFLDRENLAQVLEKCELSLFDEIFALEDSPLPLLPNCEIPVKKEDFIKLETPEKLGNRKIVPPFVPKKIVPNLNKMLADLEESVGRKMFVESAYRSPHYQAFLFLGYYLQFDSIEKTAEQVALPCHSEHGSMTRPAIDFITAEGFSDQNPSLFADRKEFLWLLENSRGYGFYLSYFGGNRFKIAFEPWHFHYEEEPKTIAEINTPLGMTRISATTEWGKFIENLPLKPQGETTKLRFRRENDKAGNVFIKKYNVIYEKYIRTMAVVDIPVSSQQDCSKHLVRLLYMFAGKDNLDLPLADGNRVSCTDNCNETWLNNAMVMIGTQTWRTVLDKVENEESVIVGDILIEPSTSHAVDEIYGDAPIGHTAVIAGIAYDPITEKRYYLIASGSLPVTDLRISRAENYWQGQDGWLSVDGYLLRAHRDSVEFYRVEGKLGEFIL